MPIVCSWSPSVHEAVEALDLIWTQDAANRQLQLALLALEALARVAMHLLELRAVVVQHFSELRALRVVELQLVGQTSRGFRRQPGRSSPTAAQERRRRIAPPSAGEATAVETVAVRRALPFRKGGHVAAEHETTRAAETEDDEHEQRKPDSGAAIGHRCLRAA